MKNLSDAGKGAYEFLGGQDFIAVFSPLAENVDVSWMSAYDQKCNELIVGQAQSYAKGRIDGNTKGAYKHGREDVACDSPKQCAERPSGNGSNGKTQHIPPAHKPRLTGGYSEYLVGICKGYDKPITQSDAFAKLL